MSLRSGFGKCHNLPQSNGTPRTQEVRTTVEELRSRGKRLGVFSNVETSESIAIEKPDPRVFEHLVKFFRVQRDRIAYVGDDPIRDIEAAKAQGLRAIQYRVSKEIYHEPWRDYRVKTKWEADTSIDRFSELLEIIE